MKLNTTQLESNILSCLKKHFIEAILGLCFFVMFILSDNVGEREHIKLLKNTMLLFPLFFAMAYTCNQIFTQKLRLLYYLSLFFFVPVLFINLQQFVFSVSYAFTMLLAFFLLLIHRSRQDNITFARDSIQTIIHLIVSLFIGHVMVLAISAIIGSLIYIFNFSWHDWFKYTYLFILFIIIPLIFCRLQDVGRFKNMPRFVDIIITYILSPAIIIYTGILYLYLITIAIHWELPKGGIGYMVLAFIIFALSGKMSQLIISKRYYDWFYDRFTFVAIPPLIIFWIGTIERITTYSFTSSRVYLLAAGILMTLFILLLLSKRFGRYQLMLIFSVFFIAILTFIPGISAKSIGVYAQERRLEKYIKQLDLLDPTTHKIKTDIDLLQDTDSLSLKKKQELQECYRYLVKEQGRSALKDKYGIDNDFPVINYKRDYISLKGEIDVSGYIHYQYFNYNKYNMEVDEDGILTLVLRQDNDTILRYNINEVINANSSLLIAADTIENSQLFVYKNEKYMLILENMIYENHAGRYKCTNVSGNALLSK